MDSSNLQNLNLNSALKHYERGISDYDSFFKFKHFFNSLELVINMAGEDKKEKVLITKSQKYPPQVRKNQRIGESSTIG
jgi:hypothetical protein